MQPDWNSFYNFPNILQAIISLHPAFFKGIIYGIMRYSFAFLFSFVCGFTTLMAQSSGIDLGFYADVLVNADGEKHRVEAHNIFYHHLKEELAQPNAFQNKFKDLKWISFQYPQDSSFRFVSWQLKRSEDEFDYFGFYQHESGFTQELKNTIPISKGIEYDDFDSEHYFGQIFIAIETFEDQEGPYHMVFGFRQLDKFSKTKIADIIRINSDGTPSFNHPKFNMKDDEIRPRIKNRILVNYSADALASIVYNPGLKMIVHDHMIQKPGFIAGQGMTQYPDGSYEGYESKDGVWEYVEKLYDHTYDEAPTPQPVGKDKDLFGKPKN